ncbi:tRNA glutamyl-Q(34) synthetase GluQRS [Roseibium sp. RKSG952]|uniref:tRNA glutamyl-Q(34) synthetase GluQRS n=1 Tax=Roseibium sp. RKSG952 TaxID=2529384 RepID=UPI0012BB5C1B|nr:tRNA glutamyl-Q(34) synthetase GluQRS [Roseibium sp. RKSG952]MTH98203.1 tRNA glutamyl-Q(34) synthetase GluQRS [Roseibium sp. RKSG952]
MSSPVFRFAPSPNGHLHLGHAYSALLNFEAARRLGGRFLLRVEDIDRTRCTPELEAAMMEDLHWLGLDWETPVLRQSERFAAYQTHLDTLTRLGLVTKSVLTRSEIKRFVVEQEQGGHVWPRDPDGAPLVPKDTAILSRDVIAERLESEANFALRLDMAKALDLLREVRPERLTWQEGGAGPDGLQQAVKTVSCDPSVWGDVVLARKDTPTSYHLSVVADDALQGVSDVLRGQDLYAATGVHRLLQTLLGLPEPLYRHHPLILGDDGRKLSKSTGSTSLRALRADGVTGADIRKRLGLG